ncbi:hypothetical protein ABT147_46575 [Streptomyces sp. NPDC001868]|uniref:hypothetical protein n=1 Tax=Streptomyces sp. NPDC001868 TaxID=3154401 RepID=UPI00332B951C
MEAAGIRKRFLGLPVNIAFDDAELARVCNSDAARRARFGPEAAATLHRRLGQMAAADHLADLHRLAAARLRPDPADNGVSRMSRSETTATSSYAPATTRPPPTVTAPLTNTPYAP